MKWPKLLKMNVIHSIRRERRSLVKGIWDPSLRFFRTCSVVLREPIRDWYGRADVSGLSRRMNSFGKMNPECQRSQSVIGSKEQMKSVVLSDSKTPTNLLAGQPLLTHPGVSRILQFEIGKERRWDAWEMSKRS